MTESPTSCMANCSDPNPTYQYPNKKEKGCRSEDIQTRSATGVLIKLIIMFLLILIIILLVMPVGCNKHVSCYGV